MKIETTYNIGSFIKIEKPKILKGVHWIEVIEITTETQDGSFYSIEYNCRDTKRNWLSVIEGRCEISFASKEEVERFKKEWNENIDKEIKEETTNLEDKKFKL